MTFWLLGFTAFNGATPLLLPNEPQSEVVRRTDCGVDAGPHRRGSAGNRFSDLIHNQLCADPNKNFERQHCRKHFQSLSTFEI